jgi:predicted flap endonuclease-1-like 5' DNA nuclease
MDPSTINADTFIVMQRTTPESGAYSSIAVDGIVTYSDRTATFTPTSPLTPNQHYGNVYTVTITDGAKDLAGNSISQDYMWSFTTGGDIYNTGTSTSQLNQSSAPISEPVVVPVATTPVVATPETNQTNAPAGVVSPFPWNWIIGGALALIILAIIAIAVSLMMTPKTVKSKKTVRALRPNPFGDVYPVLNIEGVGTKYNKGLNAIGIKNTKQLWEADAAKVARSIGAPVSSVKSWQNMAELASVKDIGPQYAELLERSGVHTIDQLKNYDATELLSIVTEKENSLKINIQGNTPGPALVENWIEEARDHMFTTSEEGQTA